MAREFTLEAVEAFPKRKKSLSASVMDLITDRLLSGVYKPGDKIPTEMEFAQSLGVGRGSVREAVKMLTSLGVLEVRRGEGTFVAESLAPSTIDPLVLGLVFEERSSLELVELRILLEAGAANILLERLTEDDVRRLEEANELLKMEAGKQDPDAQVLVDLDISFHNLLNELSGNRLLAKIYRAVSALFFASVRESVKQDPALAYENHNQIILAMKSGNRQQVQDAVRASLAFWTRFTE